MYNLQVRLRIVQHRQREPNIALDAPASTPRVLHQYAWRAPCGANARNLTYVIARQFYLVSAHHGLALLGIVDASLCYFIGLKRRGNLEADLNRPWHRVAQNAESYQRAS